MSNGCLRLTPFIATSVVLHAVAFMAAGTESLTVSTGPRGESPEVSIRLEAAAPAGAAAEANRTEPERRDTEAVAQRPQPEPVSRSETAAGTSPDIEADARREEIAARDRPEPESPLEEDTDAARQADDRAGRPAEAEVTNGRQARREPPAPPVADMPEPSPAERVAETEDPVAGEADVSSEARRAEAREAIAAELAKHFRYPRLARKRGWQGTVVLSVRILPDGRLDEIRVIDSSGRAVLDRSAREALEHVERVPRFAERIGGGGLALEIPVIYRLESA